MSSVGCFSGRFKAPTFISIDLINNVFLIPMVLYSGEIEAFTRSSAQQRSNNFSDILLNWVLLPLPYQIDLRPLLLLKQLQMVVTGFTLRVRLGH